MSLFIPSGSDSEATQTLSMLCLIFRAGWERRVPAGVGPEAAGGVTRGGEGVPAHQGTTHERWWGGDNARAREVVLERERERGMGHLWGRGWSSALGPKIAGKALIPLLLHVIFFFFPRTHPEAKWLLLEVWFLLIRLSSRVVQQIRGRLALQLLLKLLKVLITGFGEHIGQGGRRADYPLSEASFTIFHWWSSVSLFKTQSEI